MTNRHCDIGSFGADRHASLHESTTSIARVVPAHGRGVCFDGYCIGIMQLGIAHRMHRQDAAKNVRDMNSRSWCTRPNVVRPIGAERHELMRATACCGQSGIGEVLVDALSTSIYKH